MVTAKETLREMAEASVRRKKIDLAALEKSDLKRCLSLWELTFFGIGCTIGPGFYIITGQVASETAGAGVIVSYTIAALACLFSAVCYGEFAVRLPRAGSSYTYCYTTAGELFGFVIGWNIIFENIISLASVAKTWSLYLDTFANYTIQENLEVQIVPGEKPVYFDVVAFGLVFIFIAIVIVGVQVTSTANIVFTAVNIAVSLLIIGYGSYFANVANWSNFAPYGISGIIKGSGKCFTAMLGFDTVATTSEETQDRQTVPKAMLLTLLVAFLIYFSTATVLTLMVPYYDINAFNAFPAAFDYVGVDWAPYVIIIGGMASLMACILGSLYASSRILYSMAGDGLVFRPLSIISSRFQTPIYASLAVGSVGAVIALIIDLDALIEMMSIGTLMAYSGVSASVLILRYQPWTLGYTAESDLPLAGPPVVDDATETTTEMNNDIINSNKQTASTNPFDLPSTNNNNNNNNDIVFDETNPFNESSNQGGGYSAINASTNNRGESTYPPFKLSHVVLAWWEGIIGTTNWQPTERTGRWAIILTGMYVIGVVSTALLTFYGTGYITSEAGWAVALLCVFVIYTFSVGVAFFLLPRNNTKLHFTVPGVPLWCLVSLTLNMSIIITLSWLSWVRVIIWLAIGLTIYYAYGVWHSNEHQYVVAVSTDDLDAVNDDGQKFSVNKSSSSSNDKKAQSSN